jgi:hypothetical protein
LGKKITGEPTPSLYRRLRPLRVTLENMKKNLIILILLANASFVIAESQKQDLPPPVDRYPPGKATIQLDYLGSENYSADWSEISDLLDTLIGMGYLNFQINGFKYQYYCPHCEGIGYQGSDPLIFNANDLDPLYRWCSRNKGKFAKVAFGGSVKFQTVEAVAKLLNEHGVKFALVRPSDGTDFEGVKIDLLDGRPKAHIPQAL